MEDKTKERENEGLIKGMFCVALTSPRLTSQIGMNVNTTKCVMVSVQYNAFAPHVHVSNGRPFISITNLIVILESQGAKNKQILKLIKRVKKGGYVTYQIKGSVDNHAKIPLKPGVKYISHIAHRVDICLANRVVEVDDDHCIWICVYPKEKRKGREPKKKDKKEKGV